MRENHLSVDIQEKFNSKWILSGDIQGKIEDESISSVDIQGKIGGKLICHTQGLTDGKDKTGGNIETGDMSICCLLIDKLCKFSAINLYRHSMIKVFSGRAGVMAP